MMRWFIERRSLAPGLCLLALAGCASSGAAPASTAAMAPPESPAEARAELGRLEQRISSDRRALGLPPRPGVTYGGGASEAAPGPQEVEPGPEPRAAEPAPRAAEPPPAPAADDVGRTTARQPVVQSSGSSGWQRRPSNCSPGCRHTRAICNAARRICRLARYLGDDDSRERCSRAQRDCQEARDATADRDCHSCE